MDVGGLGPASYNPRAITDKQLASLKKSMVEFGDLSGVVYNLTSGNLVGGHQRVKNFDPTWKVVKEPCSDLVGTVASGYIETPYGRWNYREVEWDDIKEKAANLAANKHGGSFDAALTEHVLKELVVSDIDIELTGFSEGEIGAFDFGKVEGEGDDPAGVEDAKTGQLESLEYQLVIMCDGEVHQSDLMEEFEERGLKCRPLIL